MLIYLLICFHFMYMVAEGYNVSAIDAPDFQHIWHSYTFNTGAGNREELQFSNVELNSDFESVRDVFMWKSLHTEDQVALVGLGVDFLLITTIKGENSSATHSYEIQAPAKSLAVFQKWSVKTQRIEGFVVVATATTQENYMLLWYQIVNGKLKFLWSWQYHGSITHLDFIKINHESKLLVINQRNSTHHRPSANIYSFNMNHELDIWLFEKIILDGSPSSVAVLDSIENIFFCISFPSLETVHIYKYSKALCLDTLEEKRFVSHQKIFSIGLKSLTAFQVGFLWHLAIASNNSLIYSLNTETLLFEPLSTVPFGNFNNWLPVPVDTYRDDTILLADSDSDLHTVTWMGNKDVKVIGSFTRIACGNDTHCSEKIKRMSLNESTAFTSNGRQYIIASAKNETPLFLKLIIKLKPLPDKTVLKLNQILNEKNQLERDYNDQIDVIDQLLSEKERPSRIDTIVFSGDTNRTPETASQTKNEEEIIGEVSGLKATVDSLSVQTNEFLSGLKSSTFPQGDSAKTFVNGSTTTEGITFYGDVVIKELKLSNINGHPVDELLTDVFRKNNPQKIGGKKTLKKLVTDNVIFEKLGDIQACDIVFTDDPWDSGNSTVIQGDIAWDNKLTILNDVTILGREATPGRNSSSSEVPRGTLKHVYDSLSFDDLEVSEDLHVQRSINGRAIILPVHGGRFNVLDVVNQPRFEFVNVKQNLTVGFINGKNFSDLVKSIASRTEELELDTVSVDGVFSAPYIEADEMNGMKLSSEAYQPETSKEEKDLEENNLRRSRNLKRVIHVFENLELEGILLSNNINNNSWKVLNDTVKKNEKTVTLLGTKTFKQPLQAKSVTLNGTINGRFVDYILNNFSNQTITHPQTFDEVQFKNLTLEGAWDGVFVNALNDSLLRLSLNNGGESNVTFDGECFMNVLNVSGSANGEDVNGNDHEIYNGKIELKSVKAGHVILHGSLVTNNKINNMNVTDFNMLRVSLKSPEIVDQDVYHYNVTVAGDLNVETLNYNDVSSIINSGGDTNLIEKFMNGEIQNMKKLLVKGNITTSQGVNGFDLQKIFQSGIPITKPVSMKGNVTFENILYFDNINVTNSIDGFSLKKLEKDIVFKHSQVFLTGPKNFSTVKVTKSMRVRSLNGHLMQEVVTLKGDHTMKGPVHINGNVIVRGNVTTYSAINNITVPDLLKTYSTRFNSYIYSGDLTLSSEMVTVSNLTVSGKIQNVSLDALIRDAVRRESGMEELLDISGKKSFKGKVKFNKNITLEGLIHGVNFTALYSDLVFINKPTRLRGTVTIQASVLKDLAIVHNFNSTLINGIDTNEWIEECIPLDKYVVIGETKTFDDIHSLEDVSVDFINGHLPSAMITLKKKQHIPAPALFPRIHTDSDLPVEGLVNGLNLEKEYEDSILMNRPQTISGRTVFDGEFVVNGTLFVDTIQGKPVKSLITLDTEQVISTPLEFTGKVTAKQGVEKLSMINNISLDDWNRRAVLINEKQELTGLWTIKGRIRTKNIEGEGLVHSVSLPDISKDIQKGRLTALEIKNATEFEYSRQCQRVEQISQQLSHLPYLFHQFEMTHEIETPALIDSVITFRIGAENSLIITFVNECLSALYSWNRDAGVFEYKRQINIGPVSKWLAVERKEATYLVTSSQSHKVCEENLRQGNVWMLKKNVDGYAHLATTEAFVDVTQVDETSDVFFTVNGNGVLQEWRVQETGDVSFKVLASFGPDNHRFIDRRILGGLAMSNGREILQIIRENDHVSTRGHPLHNMQLVALPLEGKLLTAAVLKDKILIYEDIIAEKVYSIIHTHRAGSVLWFDYGANRQAFLIVASHHKLIEVHEYKGVSGLVRKMSIPMFSNRLQSVDLPVEGKHSSDKFIIVVQKRKLGFVRAEMFGDSIETSDTMC